MDTTWYKDVNNFAIHTAWAHGFMKLYAGDGVGIFAVLVLAAWWLARSQANPPRAVAASLWAAAGTVIAVGINQIIVNAVARPRPYVTLRGVEVLVSRSTDYSFPSDHTITAGAAAAGLWIIAYYSGRPAKAIAGIGTLLALFLAFSRVYVGAHYPGDVTAGLLIGAAIVVIGWVALKTILAFIVERIAERRALRSLIFARQVSHQAVHASPARTPPSTSPRSIPQPSERRRR